MKTKKLLVTLLVAFITIVFAMGLRIEQPIVVSKEVIDSIYSNNNFAYNDITKESLHQVKYLTIDANKLGNSDFFKYAKNIEELTITNYQNLINQDLNNLKYLKNLKTLYIDLDGNYALKNPNYKINLNGFTNLEVVNINCNLQNEIDSYIAYNLIKDNNIKNIVFSDELTYEQLSAWDNKINQIITSLNLTNNTEKEQATKIAKYITNNLEYDKDVYNYVLNLTRKNYSYKIDNYNTNLLSSILSNNRKTKDVICCNYAAFANILLYKSGIESYYILGNVGEDYHAWNIVNIDNNYYFMDLTFLDNNYSNSKVLISNRTIDYKMYSNYTFPTNNEGRIEATYYNTNNKYIIKWNGYILKG